MQADDAMPVPVLVPAMALDLVATPPLMVGELATGGTRSVRTIRGGALSGQAAGDVVAGSETRLARADGVTVIELSCLIAMPGGGAVRLIGTGYETDAGPFAGQRMTVAFEAAADAGDGAGTGWLATRAFVAERAAGTDVLHIARVD